MNTEDKGRYDPYNMKVPNSEMASDHHTFYVEPYAFGQYRIRITDLRQPDYYAPKGHGSIVQELWTYNVETYTRVVEELKQAKDVLGYVETLRKPWNSEFPGDRVRLDNDREEWEKINQR